MPTKPGKADSISTPRIASREFHPMPLELDLTGEHKSAAYKILASLGGALLLLWLWWPGLCTSVRRRRPAETP